MKLEEQLKQNETNNITIASINEKHKKELNKAINDLEKINLKRYIKKKSDIVISLNDAIDDILNNK